MAGAPDAEVSCFRVHGVDASTSRDDCVHDNDKTNPVAADDNDQPNVNGTLAGLRVRE